MTVKSLEMRDAILYFGFDDEYVDLVKKAANLATNGHNDSNHKYNDGSYTIHLAHVVDVAYRFIHLVPVNLRAYIIAAAWLHDSIEDARMSYNDVLRGTHVNVAEIVRAVTNYSRGRTREERMPEFVYDDIRNTLGATFIKLCDRIANIEYKGKAQMYAKEHPHFRKMLYDEKYQIMFDYIDHLFEQQIAGWTPNW